MSKKVVARVICAGIATAVACACFGEDAAPENIIVTGSRLPRADLDSASATVTIPAQMFEQSGAAFVERTLNELPQFVPSATGTANAPSSDGQANISLRGLSPSQTLVLLDGRRLLAGDGRGSVDLNVLPPALIERVDVVTGGASAVYGSDAIAGVVNFRIKHRFEGVKVDAVWQQSDRGDGEEYSTGITAGTTFADGRGGAMGYFGYTSRDGIGQGNRRFSRYPFQYFHDEKNGVGPRGAFLPSGSGIVEEGVAIVFAAPAAFENLFAGYGYAPGSVPYVPGFGVNADGSVFTIGDNAPGSVVNFRGVPDPVFFNDRAYNVYNTAPDTALQMPLDRKSVFSRLEFAFTEQIEAYVQILGADYSVDRQLPPNAAGIVLIPATNPHIGADLATLLAARANPDAPFRSFKRLSEAGPQVAHNEREIGQVTTGLRGDLSAQWNYDAYVQFARNDRNEHQSGNVQLSKLQDLTYAPDGGAAICGDFDPFVKRSLPRACIDFVTVDASNKVTIEQTIAEVSVSGPLWSLPAGDLRAAFGVLHRKDEFRFDADPVMSAVLPAVPGVIGARPDISGFEAAPDRSGKESNNDAYVELLVPLLSGTQHAQSLDLGLGYRYSDFDRAGAVDSYKAELSYRPAASIRLRGSYQHTVRAPSIEELFYPPVSGQFLINPPDPCSASSQHRNGPDRARVEALCVSQGLLSALLPSFEYPLRRIDGVSGGNPDLVPEKADTYTFGVVLTPLFGAAALDSLEITIDWYRIDIDDGIGRWQADSAVDRCFDPAFNPQYEQRNIYCSFFQRRADTGEIFAQIVDRNIGGIRTSGIDLQTAWKAELGPGTFSAHGNVGYVIDWRYVDPSGGTIDYVGTIGGEGLGRSLPEWKSLLNLDYRLRNVTVYAKWQYIDAQRDVQYRNFTVPSRNYFGLSASYEIESGRYAGFTARAGVENVLDEDPPIFPSWQQANTDPSQYDVLGRRYFLSLSYRV